MVLGDIALVHGFEKSYDFIFRSECVHLLNRQRIHLIDIYRIFLFRPIEMLLALSSL